MSASTAADVVTLLAGQLVEFLETGYDAPGLFAEDVFLDYSSPLWREQTGSRAGALAVRSAGHPGTGRVPRSRVDVTTTGFVMELEEVWDEHGESWYAREMIRADVRDGSIVDLAVYCTGDWSSSRVAQHRAEVTLLRP